MNLNCRELKPWLFWLALLSFIIYLQWSPTFADPDSFYHAKMAVLIKEQGLIKSFFWLPLTVLADNFANQHLLYHLFLVPFVLVFPPLLGVKIASTILAFFTMAAFYLFLRHYQIRWPLFYVLILLSGPAFVFRINLAKAGPLAIILLLLGLHFIWQKKYAALFLLSFVYVWTHGGWMLLIILAACSIISDLLIKKSSDKNGKNIQYLDWKLIATFLGGITAGLIINPYFPQNLKFYWEQVAQIGIWNYQGILNVGMEWLPFNLIDFIAHSAFPLILFLAALAVFLWRVSSSLDGGHPTNFQENFKKIFTLVIFSGLLGIMTLKSQRQIEYFAPFFVLTGAFLLDFSLPANFSPKDEFKKFFQKNNFNKLVTAYLLIAWLMVLTAGGYKLRENLTKQFNWRYLRDAGEWLKQNAPANTLIFHTNWSDFPMLFYHNDQNRYIAGLDPTFFYRANPELYQEWVKISRGEEPLMAEKIKKDFGAEFVLVKMGKEATPALPLLEKVEKDPHFVLQYQDKETKIFRVQ